MSETKEYLVLRATAPLRLALDEPAWNRAERLNIDEYPWYQSGQRQETDVALLYDDRAIYALFVCEDKHIHSVETRPNGNVYLDSCVEFFAIPDAANAGYFNFEANCCGTMHLGWGSGRPNRTLAGPRIHKAIKVVTSIPTPTRQESPNDDGWWLAAELPFAALAELGGANVGPLRGDTWRANFYRCGGKTDTQYASWNPIGNPKPDFHRPEFFGVLRFE